MADNEHEHEHGHGGHGGHDHGGLPDLEVAKQAFAAGELDHAVHHLCGSIGDDPLDKEALAFMDRLIEETEDKDSIAKLDGGAYYGKVAVRAYVMAKTGRVAEALDLVFRIVAAVPDVPFLKWALDWTAAFEGQASEFPLMALIQCGLEDIKKTTGRLLLYPAEQMAFRGLADILVKLEERNLLREANPMVFALCSGILRRAGLCDAAVRTGQMAYAHAPDFSTGSCLGLALRLARRWDEAAEAFRNAAEHTDESGRGTIQAELGRLAWDRGNLKAARAHFLKSLADNTDDRELSLGLAYLEARIQALEDAGQGAAAGSDADIDDIPEARVLQPGEAPKIDGLREISIEVGRELGNAVGHMTADDTRTMPQIITGLLPYPADATVNTIQQLLDEHDGQVPEGLEMQLAVSSIEAPSTRLVLALITKQEFEDIQVDVLSIPEPDPRTPKSNLDFVLWTYDGDVPERAVEEPPEAVITALAQLAARPYFMRTYYALAGMLAKGMRESGDVELEQVAAAMVFPPPPPEDSGIPVAVFVQRFQIAAALVIARWEEGEWTDSARATLLYALALGPTDWTTSAAIIALSEVALTEPQALPQVRSLFAAMLNGIPQDGYCCWAGILASCLLRLPNLRREWMGHCHYILSQQDAPAARGGGNDNEQGGGGGDDDDDNGDNGQGGIEEVENKAAAGGDEEEN